MGMFKAMAKSAATLGAAVMALACIAPPAQAQDLLVRGATVATASARGNVEDADVLVQGGIIRAVGRGLSAPAGVPVVEAKGRTLTPALFGGITEIGIEEVSGESSTVDSALKIGEQPLRPEFDVTLAYNPASVLIPVARLDGIGFTALGAATGGGFVAGQGGVVRFDGSADPIGPRALFLRLGAAASELTGQSRAAQWMLLQQMVDEARGQVAADSPHALLTPAGRRTLARYLSGQGRIVVEVDRAADIRQLLRWAAREKVKIAVAGGSAGGYLALMVGLSDDKTGPGGDPTAKHSAKVSAVIDMYGVVSFAKRGKGEVPGTSPAEQAAYLPESQCDAQDPAVLILHGTADSTVDIAQSDDMAKALRFA